MKKILTISLIFSLIVITSFIKNSTKKIDEELFSLKENILNLNLELDNVKLETGLEKRKVLGLEKSKVSIVTAEQLKDINNANIYCSYIIDGWTLLY